jgi:hypothetical protein
MTSRCETSAPWIAVLAGVFALSGLAQAQPRALDPELAWAGDNRQRLDRLLLELGSTGDRFDPERPPVAVFDWDNTVIKNDIGDGTLYWFLRNDLILQPPAGDWRTTSPFLTDAARAALDAACGEHPPGTPLPTASDLDCADEILSIYDDKRTAAGEAAWLDEGYDHRRIAPPYAWVAQLQAGHTAARIREAVGLAIDAYLAAPEGATIQVGTQTGLTGWIRIYAQIADLIGALQSHGFDVWVVSASPEPSVQAFADRVGVGHDRVIGIRALTAADGTLTADLAGCGPEADGSNRIMTYKEGKRCFIARQIFGDRAAAAVDPPRDPASRPALVAGDAQTDISMLLDASVLRLVLDRQRDEVMCHALAGTGGEWLINPMFIGPMAARTEPYPCATTGCTDRSGAPAPCLDPSGQPISDQSPR